MHHKRFLWYFLAALSLIVGMTAFLNYTIDPYGIFGGKRLEGVNELKPTAETRVRFTKPYRVSIVRPKTLIMGNSRPEMGLNPAYACWPDENKPIYNMAMPGMGLYTSLRNFQHAVAEGKIEHMVLGLDFLFFVHGDVSLDPHQWSPPKQDLEHLRVFADGSENPNFAWQWATNIFKALFSLQAMVDSVRTVAAQDNVYSSTLNLDGHNPGNQFLDIIANEGQRVLFAHKDNEIAELLSNDKAVFQGGKRWSTSFEILQNILEVAKKHGIQVTLFVNSRHADFLYLIHVSGKWELMEEWKQVLTELAEKYQTPLWDFHEFNEFSTEPPPEELGQVLDGFWEPGHYRSALGNIMIENMFFNKDCNPRKQSIGALIRTNNIENHLSDLRQQLANYITSHPDEIRRLDELFNSKLNN